MAADDLALMRRIDELHLELPFYGSRRMTFELNKEGRAVNRKRVQRLMRVMGIEALVPRPGTSQAAPGNKIGSSGNRVGDFGGFRWAGACRRGLLGGDIPRLSGRMRVAETLGSCC